MLNLQKILAPGLLFLALTLVAPVQAQIDKGRLELELVSTVVMDSVSGIVAIYPSKDGSENVAIRLAGKFPDGALVRVAVIRTDSEQLDLTLMKFELGGSYFSCNSFRDEKMPVFPTSMVKGFIVYFKDMAILEGKLP